MSPHTARRAVPLLVLAAAIAAASACASSGTALPPSDGRVAVGTWGGDTAGMIVQDTALHLHVGCTFGDVSGRPVLDQNGHFDATGTYMLHAYPVAVGPAVPARFAGTLDGATMTVTVTVDDTVGHRTVVLGPVTVTYLVEPRMRNCPICRVPGQRRP